MKNTGIGKTADLKGRIGMVMDRIGGFSGMGKALLDKFQGADLPEKTKGKSGTPEDTPVASRAQDSRAAPADKAEISLKAHQLNALRQVVDSGHEALKEVPEVRTNRLAEVRARLDKGFYNSVEVRTRVAERLNDVAGTLEEL